MDREAFAKSISHVDSLLSGEEWTRALTEARELYAAVIDEPFPDVEQTCWPLYHEMRALHALESWGEVVRLMQNHARSISETGPANNAYAHTLAMEAAAHLGEFDHFLRWARQSLELRLIDQDVKSMQRTLEASRELLRLKGRIDLLPQIIDHLYEIARDHHETELAELAREWALHTRDSIEQHIL